MSGDGVIYNVSVAFEGTDASAGVSRPESNRDLPQKQTSTNTPAQRRPHPVAHRSNAYWRGRSSGETGDMSGNPGTSTSQSLKRDRLDDTISPRGEYKRPRTDRQTRTRDSYARVTQPHLSVAVTLVPRSDMTQPEANSVQGQIQKEILAICLRKPAPGTTPYAPSFVGKAFLNEGVLKLWCYDDKALSWLQEIVPRLKSPREGTGLTLIRQADIPVRIRSALYVPDFTEEIAILQQMLSLQNPWYKVSSWTLYTYKRTNSNPPGVFLVLGIPTEQVEDILAKGRRVSYSTGSIYIRFFDGEGLSDVPPKKTPEPETKNDTATTNLKATAPGPSVENASEDIDAIEMETGTNHPSNMTPWEGVAETETDDDENANEARIQELLKGWAPEADL
ncbi:uncharacterized protein LOC120628784 [Pararge aegeria]|uniref:uncharacterized protein LOC120628784 n=1 Tax=Pararge aegeria TaxID=116150 RepID=UPI0019D10968|nr:uncharacterized protein LOC120628784 [Pararge aegeria]